MDLRLTAVYWNHNTAFHSGYITELGHERKKARLVYQYKVEETANESGHQCASKLSRSLALKASTVDATLKRLFALASKQENPEGDFHLSPVGSSKETKNPLSHRGKQVEVVHLPKILTVLPKGPKHTALKDMGLIKNITVSCQLSEAAIYDRLSCTFPDMLHSDVHPHCCCPTFSKATPSCSGF